MRSPAVVHRVLLATLLCAGLVGISAPGAGASQSTLADARPARFAATDGEQRLLTLVNRARVRQGSRPLRYSSAMSRQARAWAKLLATSRWRGRLAHSPSYWTQVRSVCRGESAGAENVAARHEAGGRGVVTRRSARGLLSQYLSSPPHRANLMDPRATHVAVATVLRRTASGRWYVANVLRFARADAC